MRGQQTRLRPLEVKVELSDNPTPQRQKIESGIKFLSRWLLNWPDDVTVMFMNLLVFSLPATLSAFGSCVGWYDGAMKCQHSRVLQRCTGQQQSPGRKMLQSEPDSGCPVRALKFSLFWFPPAEKILAYGLLSAPLSLLLRLLITLTSFTCRIFSSLCFICVNPLLPSAYYTK